jgi:hypothetical protein
MWWIYSKPNTTVGLVQCATSILPGGPYTIANHNVTLVHKSFTSAEIFVDRDPHHEASNSAPTAETAYLVYSSAHPGHQAATAVERLDQNWTASTGESSAQFGAGEPSLTNLSAVSLAARVQR